MQIFHRSFNVISRVSILGGIVLLALAAWGAINFARSHYVTNVLVAVEQPVQFSHQHHVGALGIDCRYCHVTVEKEAFAGYPSTKICMNCHNQIWVGSPYLAPVRESYRTGQSVAWNRVHNLADFAYFHHGIHVQKGIGCTTCHGPVNEMQLVWQDQTLYMEWCLDCHRQPEKYVRPRDEVFSVQYQQPPEQLALGRDLVQAYGIQSETNCTTCHR